MMEMRPLAKNNCRSGVCQQEWKDAESLQHLAGYEKAVRECGGGADKSIPSQFAASLRSDVLQYGKGSLAPGRHPGAL